MLTGLLAHVGQPAAPHDLFSYWRPDLLSAIALAAAAILYLRGRERTTRQVRSGFFAAGMVAVAIALLSPVETAGGSLASAHMVQHVLLVLVAAPLLALGGAIPTMAMGLPVRVRRAWWRLLRSVGLTPLRLRWLRSPLPVLVLYTVVFWVWHAAVPYQATLNSDLVHAAEHLSFIATALFFWQAVLVQAAGNRGLRLLAIFGAAMQATLLSALLTFAPTAWYRSYAETTPLWGLDPLTDQQLAGLLMWIPGGLVYTAAALAVLTGWLRSMEPRPASDRVPADSEPISR